MFSKEEYLGAVAAGHLHYLVMELDSPIDVRLYDDAALIRYRSQIEIEVQGQRYPRAPYWFTDAYEKRDGQWQIVWSHAKGKPKEIVELHERRDFTDDDHMSDEELKARLRALLAKV